MRTVRIMAGEVIDARPPRGFDVSDREDRDDGAEAYMPDAPVA